VSGAGSCRIRCRRPTEGEGRSWFSFCLKFWVNIRYLIL
jgi:hypothetical protein